MCLFSIFFLHFFASILKRRFLFLRRKKNAAKIWNKQESAADFKSRSNTNLQYR